jgi:hypothetical protein
MTLRSTKDGFETPRFFSIRKKKKKRKKKQPKNRKCFFVSTFLSSLGFCLYGSVLDYPVSHHYVLIYTNTYLIT